MKLFNRGPMLSARKSADYLHLSDNAFFPALKAGWIVPQVQMPRGKKTEYGFVVRYLDAVSKVLPKGRGLGMTVFTPEVRGKLDALNKRWSGKRVDFARDMKDTMRAEKQLAARR